MKIIVPHTRAGLKRETREALLPLSPLFYTLEGDAAYHDLIAALWDAREDFLVVEQDVVPSPEDVQSLLACPQPWCAFAYDYPPFGLYAGLGCARFRSVVMKRWPQAMRFCALLSDEKHSRKHWCRVDGMLKQYLQERGVQQHIHGVCRHLHSGSPAHGCVEAKGGNLSGAPAHLQVRQSVP